MENKYKGFAFILILLRLLMLILQNIYDTVVRRCVHSRWMDGRKLVLCLLKLV